MAKTTEDKPQTVLDAEAVFGSNMTKTQLEDAGITSYSNLDFATLAEQAEQVVLPGATDKNLLIGVPFVIIGWVMEDSEKYGRYVKVACVTDKNESKVFTDFGATDQGIYSILETFYSERGIKPIICREGLRKSEYGAREKDGRTLPGGTTWYLT